MKDCKHFLFIYLFYRKLSKNFNHYVHNCQLLYYYITQSTKLYVYKFATVAIVDRPIISEQLSENNKNLKLNRRTAESLTQSHR